MNVIYQIIYVALGNQCPFEQWFESVRDPRTRAVIRTRIDRLALGLFGDCRPVGGAVFELRIDYGPGFRIYYAMAGKQIVLLLTGGSKRSQKSDIRYAKELFYGWKRSNKKI